MLLRIDRFQRIMKEHDLSKVTKFTGVLLACSLKCRSSPALSVMDVFTFTFFYFEIIIGVQRVRILSLLVFTKF